MAHQPEAGPPPELLLWLDRRLAPLQRLLHEEPVDREAVRRECRAIVLSPEGQALFRYFKDRGWPLPGAELILGLGGFDD